MENREALDFFRKISEISNDPKSVKLANASDFSQMDADFILKYANEDSEGKIIIKNQFGVRDDVVVEGYSEEQHSNYFAQYRFIDKEVVNLSNIGYQNISVMDIYPPECNRWENTHFYAIVAEKQ